MKAIEVLRVCIETRLVTAFFPNSSGFDREILPEMGQLGILGATIKGQFGVRMSVVVLLYSCIYLYTVAYSLYILVYFLYTFICRVWLCWCFFCGIWAYCKGGGEVRDEGGCRGEGWRDGGRGGKILKAGNA